MKKLLATLVLAFLSLSLSVSAQDKVAPSQTQEITTAGTLVQAAKKETARQVASMLMQPEFAQYLAETLPETERLPMRKMFTEIGRDNALLSQGFDAIKAQDLSVRQWKGTQYHSNGVLELRLHTPEGWDGQLDVENLLVAFEPVGEESERTFIPAYDAFGNIHKLDAKEAPLFPVLISQIDSSEDLRAGIELVNQSLRAAGLQQGAELAERKARDLSANVEHFIGDPDPIDGGGGDDDGGTLIVDPDFDSGGGSGTGGGPPPTCRDVAYLNKIVLANDDGADWFDGKAELYAIVSGVNPVATDAEVYIVDLPSVDHKGTYYYPNKNLIYWDRFHFSAASILLYEHDDSTNYQQITVIILDIASIAFTLAGYPTVSMVIDIANAIIRNAPSHWFQNDDDHVSSFYTLDGDDIVGDGVQHVYTDAEANATMWLIRACRF